MPARLRVLLPRATHLTRTLTAPSSIAGTTVTTTASTTTARARCRVAASFSPSSSSFSSLSHPSRRSMTSTAAAMQQQQQQQQQQKPRFSPGTDEAASWAALEPLLSPDGNAAASTAVGQANEGGSGRWTLAKDGEALERTFRFKTFAKTWDFMTAVSLQCKINNHHPEWSNVYNTTFVRWTTHSPRGLSRKDIDLARACDDIARQLGELEPGPGPASCEVRALADGVAAGNPDCCTKPSK